MFHDLSVPGRHGLADKLSVSARLTITFGMMICMLIVGSVLGLTSLSSLHQKLESQSNNRTPSLVLVSRWQEALATAARRTRNALLQTDVEQARSELQAVRGDQQARARLAADLDRLVTAESGRALLQEIRLAAQAHTAFEAELERLAAAGNLDDARKLLLEKAGPVEAAYQGALGKFVAHLEAESRDASHESTASYEASRNVMFVLSLLAIVFAAVVATLFSRRLRLQLGGEPTYATHVASSIANGDLSLEVEVRPGDRSSLIYAMSQMAVSLRQLVGEVANGAQVVADTSQQIAQGNVDLSQRTEEQACTLEETASSMEQLTTTVMQNAESAKQAKQLAVGASDVARRGGHVVGEVVSTMTGISESSRKIADIIAVIDSIAFQTNILALNASVEAARAGEQGRGFAVVASEVRNLAQRSAAAAKEIKTLIGDSVDKVEAGAKLVDAAGRTMDEIVDSVKGVTDLIAEIAAASQEQSSGIEQVNMAVAQMDQAVQQNASLVEEATAATESMKEQAGALLQSVSRFKLGGAQDGGYTDVHHSQPRPATQVAHAGHATQPRPARAWAERPAHLRGAAVTALGAPQPQKQASADWQEF